MVRNLRSFCDGEHHVDEQNGHAATSRAPAKITLRAFTMRPRAKYGFCAWTCPISIPNPETAEPASTSGIAGRPPFSLSEFSSGAPATITMRLGIPHGGLWRWNWRQVTKSTDLVLRARLVCD